MIFSIVAVVVALGNILWAYSFGPNVTSGLFGLAVFNGIVALALALVGFFTYRGRRLMPNPKIGKPPIWTLRRAFTFVALVAAVGAILVPLASLIGW